MRPHMKITLDDNALELYNAPLADNDDCATMFYCVIARGPYTTASSQVSISAAEHKWLVGYLRSKSIMLIPRIVFTFISEITWKNIKAELIRL